MVVMDFHRVVVVVVREALERMLSQPIVLETGVPASSQAYLAKPMVKVGGLRVVEVVGWIIAHRPSLVRGWGVWGVGVTAEEERANLVYLIPVVGVGVQIIQVQMYMVATVAQASFSFDTLWTPQSSQPKKPWRSSTRVLGRRRPTLGTPRVSPTQIFSWLVGVGVEDHRVDILQLVVVVVVKLCID